MSITGTWFAIISAHIQRLESQISVKGRINVTTNWQGLLLPYSWKISIKSSFSSVAQSCPILLRTHELQHARPPCPSPTPRVHSDSHPSSQWCHPAISSSVVPFSSCPQSLPASESFPMSQLFTWGGQSTRISASASFPPKKCQGWSLSEWTGWISCNPRDTQESSPTPQFKSIRSTELSFLYSPTLTSIHDYWKNITLTRRTFVSKVMSLFLICCLGWP